ncbi:uncharacterized protein LOC133737643 [Rosa rugosa]|uniref:uncharacterized protein LOC133737643 n=1 Tax=Rosa rugosa TaxID=74645 RepID=UPI002B40D744|nr:uncharacterized protein LOC133737643 [Rosa rugosa]
MDVLKNVLVSTSNGDPYKDLWRCIWRAKIPGKVSICAWRACNNLLPTRDRLFTKGYEGPMQCILCNYPVEDVSHVFCKCAVAAKILKAPPFQLQHTILPSLNFKEWMLERATSLKPELFAKLSMILWPLWRNRNNCLWNGSKQTAHDISLSSFAWLEDFQKARQSTTAGNNAQQEKVWEPAAYGALKLNVDAAFLPQHTKGGIGGVIRDAQGKFVAAFASPVAHTASPKQCELIAIRAGLDLLHSLRIQHVIVESDCMEAIAEIQCRDHTFLANGGLIDDIKHAAAQVHSIQIRHTPRSCNRVAHRLAAIGFEASISSCNLV